MESPSSVTLAWNDRDRAPRIPPARLEPVCSGSDTARLIEGDNLAVLSALAAEGPRYALAYLDPPFLTGRQHHRVHRVRNRASGRIERGQTPAFDDRWVDLGHYLSTLKPRVAAARELLLEEGSLVLHVDSKTSHYAKVLCDEIFGPECFASEIIWRYRRWPSRTDNFQRVHDVLLRYVRCATAKSRFNQLYEPLAPSTLATWGKRRQRAVLDAEGRRVRSSSTQDLSPGVPLGDVWEIGIVAPVAKERTGYPTQKPEALLERVVGACSDPGDAILDPYCGSGTSVVVAAKMGRTAVGIDLNGEGLDIAQHRLEAHDVVARRERGLPASSPSKARHRQLPSQRVA